MPETIPSYTPSWCGDIEDDAAAAAPLMRGNGGNRSVSTVVLRDAEMITEPSISELLDRLRPGGARSGER